MTRYLDLKKLFLTGFLVFWGCGLPPGIGPAPPFYSVAVSPTPVYSTPSLISATFSPNPQVAADGNNNVFVVWQDSSSIYFTYSTTGGAKFTTPSPVPGSVGGSYPRIATDGSGNIFVTWYNATTASIQFNYAVANTFSTSPFLISTNPAAFPAGIPPYPPQEDINFTAGMLSLAWSQCTTSAFSCPDDEIYTSSTAIPANLTLTSIISFSSPAQISNSGVFAGYPRIKQTSNQSYIQYFQNLPTTGLVLYLNNTQTLSTQTIQINSVPGGAYNSSLELDSSGKAVSAWNPVPSTPTPNNPSKFDIFSNFLPNNGISYSTPQNITNNGASYGPALAIDSSEYFNLALFSKSAGQTLNDLFLTRSTDGGKTFPSFFNLSMTPGGYSSSYAPSLAVVGKIAYLVWDEEVPTNITGINASQIYFEKLNLH